MQPPGGAACLHWRCCPLPRGFAAHPLITEDTATQGRGNGQLELTLAYGHDEATDAEQDAADLAAVLSWGVRDRPDLLLTVPYWRVDTEVDGAATTVHGLGDVGLDAKWRFFEAGGLSVALKTGATYPSGDETQGLGAGKLPSASIRWRRTRRRSGAGICTSRISATAMRSTSAKRSGTPRSR